MSLPPWSIAFRPEHIQFSVIATLYMPQHSSRLHALPPDPLKLFRPDVQLNPRVVHKTQLICNVRHTLYILMPLQFARMYIRIYIIHVLGETVRINFNVNILLLAAKKNPF